MIFRSVEEAILYTKGNAPVYRVNIDASSVYGRSFGDKMRKVEFLFAEENIKVVGTEMSNIYQPYFDEDNNTFYDGDGVFCVVVKIQQ